MRQKDPEALKRRQKKIVEATVALIASGQAPSEITVAEITRQAGMSVGAFYLSFESREGVMAHLMRRQLEQVATGGGTARELAMVAAHYLPPELGRLIRAEIALKSADE